MLPAWCSRDRSAHYHGAGLMSRIRLIHWKQEEAIERAGALRRLGHAVDAEPLQTTGAMKSLRDDPPEAFVIDLSRLPSHGRTIGMVLRQTKGTRAIPLVFVDGAPEKIDATRSLLPDAVFTTWEKIGRDLRRAIAAPPREPIVPKSNSGGYSGTPLPKKLGVRPGAIVGLVGAPRDFDKTLGSLPAGAKVKRNPKSACELLLWFVTRRADLTRNMRATSALINRDRGGLWIIWPKQSSGITSDLKESVVRDAGLASGLVDYKVCAVDATWSGLKFARRKKN
jgi:hypothetical protein